MPYLLSSRQKSFLRSVCSVKTRVTPSMAVHTHSRRSGSAPRLPAQARLSRCTSSSRPPQPMNICSTVFLERPASESSMQMRRTKRVASTCSGVIARGLRAERVESSRRCGEPPGGTSLLAKRIMTGSRPMRLTCSWMRSLSSMITLMTRTMAGSTDSRCTVASISMMGTTPYCVMRFSRMRGWCVKSSMSRSHMRSISLSDADGASSAMSAMHSRSRSDSRSRAAASSSSSSSSSKPAKGSSSSRPPLAESSGPYMVPRLLSVRLSDLASSAAACMSFSSSSSPRSKSPSRPKSPSMSSSSSSRKALSRTAASFLPSRPKPTELMRAWPRLSPALTAPTGPLGPALENAAVGNLSLALKRMVWSSSSPPAEASSSSSAKAASQSSSSEPRSGAAALLRSVDAEEAPLSVGRSSRTLPSLMVASPSSSSSISTKASKSKSLVSPILPGCDGRLRGPFAVWKSPSSSEKAGDAVESRAAPRECASCSCSLLLCSRAMRTVWSMTSWSRSSGASAPSAPPTEAAKSVASAFSSCIFVFAWSQRYLPAFSRSAARGRMFGSFWKHAMRKSCSARERLSGKGG
mmetsp:Transcript_6304/g.17656  ORF Transcript_6304/g.17656 Transcript_6304/m.17656 type:complete len:579 (-) Transcript_6304:332-2068(-)